MITPDEHLTTILAAVHPLGATSPCPSPDAQGATLRRSVQAAVDLPLFDNSAMDGFAVRFADVEAANAAFPRSPPASWPICLPGPRSTLSSGPRRSSADHDGRTVADELPSTTVVPFEATTGGLADSLGEVAGRGTPHGQIGCAHPSSR